MNALHWEQKNRQASQLDPQSEIWKKIQMAEEKFRLISGLAELTRETKITAEMRLVANIFGCKITKSNKNMLLNLWLQRLFYEAEQYNTV